MREKQVIEKLKTLKAMNPPKPTFEKIKRGVYYRVNEKDNPRNVFDFRLLYEKVNFLVKSYTILALGLTFGLILIIFLPLFSLLFPYQMHNMILYGRITFISNRYQKASIAFADTSSRFNKNRASDINFEQFSRSLALTNTQVNNLKLKGEKGKYTAKQCQQIYRQYLSYLMSEEKTLSASDNQLPSTIKSQINDYEEQAEKKLHMYHSL